MPLLEHRERVTASVLILGIFFSFERVIFSSSSTSFNLQNLICVWYISPDPFSSSLISVSVKSFGSFNYSSVGIISCHIIMAFLITLICADITLISIFFSFKNFQKPFYIIYNIISNKKILQNFHKK